MKEGKEKIAETACILNHFYVQEKMLIMIQNLMIVLIQLKLDFENPGSDWYIKEPSARYEALNDKDEYRAENIFFVPEKARWSYLQSVAKQPEIGKYLDEAMVEIERENPTLKGVLPKVYAVKLDVAVDVCSQEGVRHTCAAV